MFTLFIDRRDKRPFQPYLSQDFAPLATGRDAVARKCDEKKILGRKGGLGTGCGVKKVGAIVTSREVPFP